jgi:hypothetical protein
MREVLKYKITKTPTGSIVDLGTPPEQVDLCDKCITEDPTKPMVTMSSKSGLPLDFSYVKISNMDISSRYNKFDVVENNLFSQRGMGVVQSRTGVVVNGISQSNMCLYFSLASWFIKSFEMEQTSENWNLVACRIKYILNVGHVLGGKNVFVDLANTMGESNQISLAAYLFRAKIVIITAGDLPRSITIYNPVVCERVWVLNHWRDVHFDAIMPAKSEIHVSDNSEIKQLIQYKMDELDLWKARGIIDEDTYKTAFDEYCNQF